MLQVLAATTMSLTGRQVAALTGRRSHSGVLAALSRLTEHGLVERVELNKASLFSLNREHLAYPAVIALTGIRLVLLGRLKQELATWSIAPLHASLFGSTARGDGDTSSDIDLLVIRPTAATAEDAGWREQIATLEEKVSQWTGNRAAVVEISEDEVPRLVADDRPILAALRADAIVLAGVPVATLLDEA
ncbi:MAG TPA: nucleotidyltransferase domain-containing protein [Solirubrobacteraceae bacterium]|nr:nucleotidyltransferase domain-containing protein [Solirubrobacteraceae bacterium]